MATDRIALRGEAGADLPTVLIVEDEPTTRQTMRLFLRTCGYGSIEAETVERAVEALSGTISAAVLDVELTGNRSGLEVLGPLRLRPELADIPVLVLTGGILSDTEEAYVKQQHAYVFYKPEGYDTIVSFLDRLTGRAPVAATRAAAGETTVTALRRQFLSDVQRESQSLACASIQEFDRAAARPILHRWSGIAGTLGFTEISRRALELQTLVDASGTVAADRLRSGVADIGHLCADISRAYEQSAPGVPDHQRVRVIVADDDRTITSLVQAAFHNYDFDCEVAFEGGAALELVRTGQPDVLVLDVNMPQFDGFEVLDTIKNDPATSRIAVVLLSARQQEADIMRGFALGADDYVVKPFSPLELIARVKRLLRKRAA